MKAQRSIPTPFSLKTLLTGGGAAALALAAGLLAAAPSPAPVHAGVSRALALNAFRAGAAFPRPFQAGAAPRRGSDGRYIYDRASLQASGAQAAGFAAGRRQSGAIRRPRAAAGTPLINEGVQTFDVFNPPPAFTPTQGPSLTPTNLTPVWTADETMIVFSSNRNAAGGVGPRYHIWAIPINGGAPVQLTDSTGGMGGGEFFPTLSGGVNQFLAFTSDAQTPGTATTPGVQNLYRIPFTTSTINVSDPGQTTSLTVRNDAFAQNAGGTGFSQVERPTFAAGRTDEIVFSALTSAAGAYQNRYHLYYLFIGTGGSDPSAPSLPGRLTDGPADDTDPAYSADGQFIAFASTASSLSVNTQTGGSSNPALTLTAGPRANRSLFLVGGGARSNGFGTVPLSGKPLTTAGDDDYGPAWSSLNRNPYLNPAPGAEYLAFSRGASPASPHDIYYLQVLQNIDANGESGRSNEAASTPLLPSTPVYSVNAGGGTVAGNGAAVNTFTADGGTAGVSVTGGTVETITPAPIVNTVGDPTAPPAIYNTDRNGTFSYAFSNLTPGVPYTVRLHLSDPKNTAPGKRVFTVAATGAVPQTVDIVQLAQSTPGRVDGVVSDSASTPTANAPLAGATLTVTDLAGNAVATTPSPLVTAATTTPDPAGGTPINYSTPLPQGTFVVTASAPGYPSKSQTLSVGSGAVVRADFSLTKATGTVTGQVRNASVGGPAGVLSGITITAIEQTSAAGAPGATAGTTTTDASGNYTLTLPVGSYYLTATPRDTFQVLTQSVTITSAPATPTTQNFSLASGTAVGTLGGLITNAASAQPLGGVLIEVLGPNGVIALVSSTATTSTAAAPTGDTKPTNYSAVLPLGPVSLKYVSPGFTTANATATVVNTAAAGNTAPNAFVRQDEALVSTTPVAGQNTAVTLDIPNATVSQGNITNAAGLITTAAGTITVAFAPAANGGDPPIVEGIEILAGPDGFQSSGLGANGQNFNTNFNNAFGSLTPILDQVYGGDTTTATGATTGAATTGGPFINLNYYSFNGTPSYYNIYRTTQGSGQEGNTPYVTGVTDTFYNDTGVQDGVEYFYQVTAVYNQVLLSEGVQPAPASGAAPITNAAIKLNTDDNAVSTLGGQYEDAYPTWSPTLSVYSIAYSSNRTVTYNDPVTGRPSETAISVGQSPSAGALVGPGYAGIFESQVLNLDPPTLVPYSGTEIVHIADQNGTTSRANLTGGRPMSITVRLSDREAGVDDNNVYAQVKDPDSKYQDSQRLEHKVFARDSQFRGQGNNPNRNNPDSGSSSLLYNGGGAAGYNYFAGNLGGPEAQRGAVAGVDASNESISVGVIPAANLNSTNPITTGDDGKPLLDSKGNPAIPPGFDPQFYQPTGPEFECQTVNPAYASDSAGSGTDTSTADYTNPYYLAGVDDQRAFSGFPANGSLIGQVYTVDARGNQNPLGGATVTLTDYFTGTAVATSPSPLISTAANTNTSSGFNLSATLAPGQYRATITLSGYKTQIQALTVSERGTVFLNASLTPGTGTVDKSAGLSPSSFGGNGFGHLPRPTANSTIKVSATTPSGQSVSSSVFHPAEWLKMTRLPDAQQDGGGGVLYSVTWTPPATGSDFYLDVIAYDKAVFPTLAGGTSPFTGERSNWRIYDNVWGFSTQRDIGSNDILFVSDYALGQKFAATTFGGQNSLVNLVPKFYGAESYLTDIDLSLIPNATYVSRVIAGRKFPITEVLPLAVLNRGSGSSADGYPLSHQLNGLGVGSYTDVNIDSALDDTGVVDGAPTVRSQQYSIWRTLSRGPVPQSVFQAYQPTKAPQPAVSDSTVTPAVTVMAGTVTVAPRCIVWSAPFAGDLLVGPGTITDPATQASLRAFVKAGGRLFITGQDIGSTLTQGGTMGNSSGGFLPDVLGATLVTPNKGTFIGAGGGDAVKNRISNTAFFDGSTRMNFYQANDAGFYDYLPPYKAPIVLGNNIGGNAFGDTYFHPDQVPFWRTDGSLDQLGPYATSFNGNGFNGQGNSVVGQIDTIAPVTGGFADITLNAFTNVYGRTTTGDPNAANSPGGTGLVYFDGTGTGGTGAKVVYASFGFEALSTDYYSRDIGDPKVRYYFPHNQRQNMLHNVVCYLRTGTLRGTVQSTTGNGSPATGIGGATVYLVSASGAKIPGRGTFSALSDPATGNFTITGVEPGTYTVAAYKNGYTRTVSNQTTTYTVEGDSNQTASVSLAPAAPGSVSGTVKDAAGNLIAGATVSFVPDGGGTTQSTVTDANGRYSLPTLPSGSYTATASDPPAFGASAPQTVVITAGAAQTASFTLTASAGKVTGRVINASGAGIAGATVTVTTGSPAKVVTTVTTASDGTYTFSAPAGSYTLTATATNSGNATVTVQAAGGATVQAPDLVLGAVTNGTLGGLVLATGGNAPLAGVTITATNTGTLATTPVTTTATPVTATDGGTINYGPVSLATGTYTVTASRGGVTTASQTVTITAGGFTRVDFSGVNGLPAVHTFPAGLQFVSLPYDYSGLGFDGVFGPLNTATSAGNRSHVALWNPLTSSYALDPAPPADAPRLGVGYWVFLKNTTAVTQTGATPPATVSVALHPAWNMIGVPDAGGIAASALQFTGGDGVPRTFASAASAQFHLVSPTLYRYDGAAYQPVAATDTLQPWTAYWIRVYTDVTLTIPAGR